MPLAGELTQFGTCCKFNPQKNQTELFIKGKSEISCGVPLIAPISDATCAQRYPHSSYRVTIYMQLEEKQIQIDTHCVLLPLKLQRVGKLFIMDGQQLGGKLEISHVESADHCTKTCAAYAQRYHH